MPPTLKLGNFLKWHPLFSKWNWKWERSEMERRKWEIGRVLEMEVENGTGKFLNVEMGSWAVS
jgi:hypothetical protein